MKHTSLTTLTQTGRGAKPIFSKAVRQNVKDFELKSALESNSIKIDGSQNSLSAVAMEFRGKELELQGKNPHAYGIDTVSKKTIKRLAKDLQFHKRSVMHANAGRKEGSKDLKNHISFAACTGATLYGDDNTRLIDPRGTANFDRATVLVGNLKKTTKMESI